MTLIQSYPQLTCREVSEGQSPSDLKSFPCGDFAKPSVCQNQFAFQANRQSIGLPPWHVRRERGHFCGGKPVDQSKNAFLADLPPGNRLRFQANLEGVVSAGELAPPSERNYSVED